MANRVKTIFGNMSWLMVSQIVNSLLAFIWTILITRYLGPTEYGVYGSTLSFAGLFLIITDLGISSYVIRTVSTDFDKEEYYLKNVFSLTIFLAVLYLIVVLIVLQVLGWNNYMTFFCLLFAFENIIVRFSATFGISYQVHEELKYSAISTLITTISSFILILIVIFGSFKLLGVALAFVLANIFALLYNIYIGCKYFVKPKFLFNRSFYKKLLIGGLPFAISGIFYNIYYSIDIVMITQFVGTYETGLYNAAYKLITVLTLFYTIYITAVYPVMTKLFEDSKELLSFSFVKSMKYLLLVTVPIAVFTCFYSVDIINIYGHEFKEASTVLSILIWTVCFLFVNGACSLVLNASYKEYAVTKILAIAAFFNVVLNLFLIPNYSIYGAAVATVLSEILIFVLEMYTIKKIDQLPDRHFVFDVFKIALASGIMGIVLYYLNLNLWLAMPVSIIVYFAAIFLLKTQDDMDMIIIKQILNR